MKSQPHWTRFAHRIAGPRSVAGVVAGVAAAVIGLTAPAQAQMPNNQPSDETIGSHPSTRGDGVRRETPRGLAPVLYLAGPETSVLAALDATVALGDGATLVRTSADEVRLELDGRLRASIDLAALLEGDVRLGVRAGSVGAGAIVALSRDGHASPPVRLPRGAALELPVERLHAAGLLDGSAALELVAPGAGRTRLGLLSAGGRLIIGPNL